MSDTSHSSKYLGGNHNKGRGSDDMSSDESSGSDAVQLPTRQGARSSGPSSTRRTVQRRTGSAAAMPLDMSQSSSDSDSDSDISLPEGRSSPARRAWRDKSRLALSDSDSSDNSVPVRSSKAKPAAKPQKTLHPQIADVFCQRETQSRTEIEARHNDDKRRIMLKIIEQREKIKQRVARREADEKREQEESSRRAEERDAARWKDEKNFEKRVKSP
eukprot:TRINITY_DN1631_c0_g1_i1.p2 TRINITY_DN1631_c0_g1~~TRINITY_DN1631_c0_g1_i1.p2  ORF type:complete len:216 (+),score=76.82 TRINITY_DN1631_c0_g1_i1:260-907(+)